MSYILDALKRADSEREREREDVPGLHSRTDTWVAPDEVRAVPSKPQAALWALGGAGLMVMLGSLWFFLTREAATVVKAPVAAAPVAAAPAASVAPPVAVIMPLPVLVPVPAAPPLPVIAAATAVPQPAPVPAPAPGRQTRSVEPVPPSAAAKPKPKAQAPSVDAAAPAAARAAASVATSATATAPARAPASAAALAAAPAATTAATTTTTTAPEARVYTLSELPDDVRAGLPSLAVGGAMYSQTPANRMLIINGQIYREGDTLAPGLVLEQIKLKSAVLKVKGLRYGISY